MVAKAFPVFILITILNKMLQTCSLYHGTVMHVNCQK
jgi:hypothetical protein